MSLHSMDIHGWLSPMVWLSHPCEAAICPSSGNSWPSGTAFAELFDSLELHFMYKTTSGASLWVIWDLCQPAAKQPLSGSP